MKRFAFACLATLLFVTPTGYGADAVGMRAEQSGTQKDPEALIRAILAQPAYQQAPVPVNRSSEPTIWERVRSWVAERIRSILRSLASLFHGARGTGNALGILLIVVSGAALLFLFTRLFFRFAESSVSASALKKTETSKPERNAAAWHAFSEEAASQGRYGAAVSALFMAALRLLDERGVAAFDPARTPNEYRRRVGSALSAASPSFEELASCFVRATYGQTMPEASLYDTAASAYAAFSHTIPVL